MWVRDKRGAGEKRGKGKGTREKEGKGGKADGQTCNLIICRISGSGNKAVIYQHLKNLTPKAQAAKQAEETEESAEPQTVTINGETAQIIRNKEEMRLQLIFDGKPSEDTRNKLKSNGFRWAPSCGAWQRLLNGNSEYALKRIIG